MGQGPQGGVALRVPLHAHRAGGLERRPLPVIGVKPRIEAARAGPAQGLLEARPAHPHRQDPLLAGFDGPPAAVHHPQEGRLDPGHPAAAEGRHEPAGGHRGPGDGRTVGLVDGYGLLIPHGPHLTTGTGCGRGAGLLTHGPQPATSASPRPSGAPHAVDGEQPTAPASPRPSGPDARAPRPPVFGNGPARRTIPARPPSGLPVVRTGGAGGEQQPGQGGNRRRPVRHLDLDRPAVGVDGARIPPAPGPLAPS